MAKMFLSLINRFKILNKPQVVHSLKKIAEKQTINKLVKTSDKEGKKNLQMKKDKNDSRYPIRNVARKKTQRESFETLRERN